MRYLLLSTVFLAGCVPGPHTEVHVDETRPMTGFVTFHVRSHEPSETSPALTAAQREIERAIVDALHDKGYRQVKAGQGDFEVEYVTYVTEQYQEGSHDRYLFDDHLRLMAGAEPAIADPIREGTLHIHLSSQGEPFYEAIASDVIDRPKSVDKRIRAAVIDLLANVPAANR